MSVSSKNEKKSARIRKIRSTVKGTAKRPRLVINVSNKALSAQLIDDESGRTLASARVSEAKKTKTEMAAMLGASIADKAKKAKITEAVFDRRGRKFHNRLKALTEAANEKGLKV